MVLALIVLFGCTSYLIAIHNMARGAYKPSLFSRIVWLLLATNSFFAVIYSGGSLSAKVLAGVSLLGNIAVCSYSFFKGTKTFGRLEMVCLSLIAISGILWIVLDAPIINLLVGLSAHFLGGLPTIKRVWLNPKDEVTGFWLFFSLASLLSLAISDWSSITSIIFPLYFTVFEGSLTILSIRKPSPKLTPSSLN